MRRVTAFAVAVLGLALTIAATTVSAQDKLDRTVLPIAEPKRPTYTELDARTIAEYAMSVAASICIYTNGTLAVEEL